MSINSDVPNVQVRDVPMCNINAYALHFNWA